jgi:N-acetylmuramoyl-L-alanine amidase
MKGCGAQQTAAPAQLVFMEIITSHRSPNFSDLLIPVEFVVVHYTACTLERTLEIFMDRTMEASAHIVIDRDGSVFELVDCLNGAAKRAWHAGKSRYEVSRESDRVHVEAFNDRSIGIELVNLNGNIFPYTEAQYASLFALLEVLKGLYPNLTRPDAIIGHEQIAGFRGKCDPGRLFEWERLYSVCFPGQGLPDRRSLCSEAMAGRIRDMLGLLGVESTAHSAEVSVPAHIPTRFFGLLNALCEAALSRE